MLIQNMEQQHSIAIYCRECEVYKEQKIEEKHGSRGKETRLVKL